MAKRKFYLTTEQSLELRVNMKTCGDAATNTRLKAVLLYGTGVPAEKILKRLGCSRSSLMHWCQAYRSLGVEGLQDRRQGGNNAKLSTKQIADLAIKLKQDNPGELLGPMAATPQGEHWMVEDLYKAIKYWYGVVYRSRSSYHNLLSLCLSDSQQTKNIESASQNKHDH